MVGKQVLKLLDTLEQEIVTGQLSPGIRLDQAGLAKRFGVSRTPVREALNRLAATGLVELRPRRGAIVAAPGLRELLNMFEVMAELEGLCGRLAAQRMSVTEQACLQAAHEASRLYVKSADSESYYQANVGFHEILYSGCHNRFLGDQTRGLRNRLAAYRRLQLRQHNRISDSFHEHEQILAAIIAGDSDQTDRLLKNHVTIQSGSFTDFVTNLSVTGIKHQPSVVETQKTTITRDF